MLLLPLALLSFHVAEAKKAAPVELPTWYLTPPAGCAAGSATFDVNMQEASKLEADSSARADLTRQVQSQVTTFVQTAYSKVSGSGGGTSSSGSMESVTKVSTDMSLLGARAVASEIKGDKLYLMVCIEPKTLVQSFQEMAYLDDAMRMALVDGANGAYGKQAGQLAALGFSH